MRLLLSIIALFSLVFTAAGQPSKSRQLPFEHRHETRSAGGFIYTLETTSSAYSDLSNPVSINNGELWDDPEYVVDIPFDFYVNGMQTYSLQFVGLGAFYNGTTDEPFVFSAIAPFEVDLIDRGVIGGGSQSPISYQVDGDPGSRIFKLEWKNAGSFDEVDAFGTAEMFVNLQMWLYEGSNTIEFRFGASNITDPDLFYFGETGALSGFASFDEEQELFWDDHFLAGPADNPVLTHLDFFNIPFLDGTPADGTVYRFYIESDSLSAVVTTTDANCGENNGTATVEVTGGLEPYTYVWHNGDTLQSIDSLAAGIVSVTVTDSEGNTAVAEGALDFIDPVVANAGSTDETGYEYSDGTAWAAPFGGISPYTYMWSTGNTDSLITGLQGGTYRVTVTDASGCTDWQEVEVIGYVCMELNLEVVQTHVTCFGACNGSIEILDISGGTGPFTFLWSTGDSSAQLLNVCAGIYDVSVTGSDGCNSVETFGIFEPVPLTANASGSDETLEDGNDGSASATPSGGVMPYSYSWSNGATDSLIADLSPGIYHVTVTDANDCTASEIVLINAFGCPALTLSSQMWNVNCSGICDAAIEIVDVSSGAAPYSYLWSNDSTGAVIEFICAGEYTVVVGDTNECYILEAFIVPDGNVLQANAGVTNETGPGLLDGAAWAAPTGGVPPYSYEWSTGSTDSLITGLGAGVYTVIVTESASSCTDTQTVVVNTIGCALDVQVSTSPTCIDTCVGEIALTVSGGMEPYMFEWNDGSTDQNRIDLCEGVYVVTIMDAIGCVLTPVVELFVINPLFADAGSTGETGFGTGDGSAWAIPTGGIPPYLYEWSNGSTDSVIVDLLPGEYFVTITDQNGCAAVAGVLIEEYVCTATINSAIEPIACYGECSGAILIEVAGGVGPFTYLWNTGDTTATIDGLCEGAYSVLVTDTDNGCSALFTVDLNDPEILDFTVDDVVHLTDTTQASIAITPFGGTPPYTYQWYGPNGFNSSEEDVNGIQPGYYLLFIRDVNDCEVVLDSIEILDLRTSGVRDLPQLDVTLYPNPTNGILNLDVPAAQFELVLMQADGRIIGRWENVRALNTETLGAGVYLVRVTSKEGSYSGKISVLK